MRNSGYEQRCHDDSVLDHKNVEEDLLFILQRGSVLNTCKDTNIQTSLAVTAYGMNSD